MLVHDLRYAIRLLRQRPWVTASILLTLAIGIGANTAIFSFVDAIILKPLPYPNGSRMISLWERRIWAPSRSGTTNVQRVSRNC